MARLVPSRLALGYELIETGGGQLATGGRSEVAWEEWTDEEWSLVPTGARIPLLDSAITALVVAMKLLLGTPLPVPREPPPPAPEWE